MNYKKLVSLLAVSAFALSACGTTDTAEEPAEETTEETAEAPEEETTTEESGEHASSEDLIQQAQDESTGEAFPEYGLYVAGSWTEDGIVVPHAPGEAATIPVQVTSDHTEYNVYLLENGVVAQVISNEPEPEFTVESPSADTEYVVGISPDDLGQEGDEVAMEDFYRSEKVILTEQEPTAEEE